jgi:hypothetical protein
VTPVLDVAQGEVAAGVVDQALVGGVRIGQLALQRPAAHVQSIGHHSLR